MTFPKDQSVQRLEGAAPSYVVGLLLNMFLTGAGFTYVNRWGWHLTWFGASVLLWLLTLVLSATTHAPWVLLLPLAGWAAQLVHYHWVYTAQMKRQFQPKVDHGLKVGLWVAHLAVGFVGFGIVSAVIIPNLLTVRPNIILMTERNLARQAYLEVAAQQANGTLKAGSCPALTIESELVQIKSCTVDLTDSENPAVDVTFGSGRTIHLPEP